MDVSPFAMFENRCERFGMSGFIVEQDRARYMLQLRVSHLSATAIRKVPMSITFKDTETHVERKLMISIPMMLQMMNISELPFPTEWRE